eukprot:scpid58967/ scgid21153/ Tyrosine--tRNA ligase, cytoplasmic; Tyrosyl-tRNA synthetase
MMNPMVPGLTGGKMSSSDADSKIDMLDTAEDVKKKIRKAFCEEGNVAENGVLMFVKYVLIPISGREEFVIERQEKHGGNMTFENYQALEDAFAKKEVYPLDLKNAVTIALNKLMDPIRAKFDNSAELTELLHSAYPESKKAAPAEAKAAAKSAKAPKQQAAKAADRAVDVSRLDFRVGRIVSAAMHPEADKLYVESVDVGEAEPRTVVSGLAGKVPLEEMQGRLAVLLCNLKPVNMRGVKSHAMVMCAVSEDGTTDVLTPPADCAPGDRVFVPGFEHEKCGEPDQVLNPKKKVFEQIQPDLRTLEDKTAGYKGIPWQTAKGPVVSLSLSDAVIR